MRKEVVITLNDRGRDLKFKIKQMCVTQQESWLIRTSLLIARSLGRGDFDIGRLLSGDGLRGFVMSGDAIKALAGLSYEEAVPLLEELLKCCSRVLDSGGEMQCSTETVDGYIEDVLTLLNLRAEAFKLCFFSEKAEGILSSSHASEVIKILKTNKEN